MISELLPNSQLMERVLGTSLVKLQIAGVTLEEEASSELVLVRVEIGEVALEVRNGGNCVSVRCEV